MNLVIVIKFLMQIFGKENIDNVRFKLSVLDHIGIFFILKSIQKREKFVIEINWTACGIILILRISAFSSCQLLLLDI